MAIWRPTTVLAFASLCASVNGCGARSALSVESMARGGASANVGSANVGSANAGGANAGGANAGGASAGSTSAGSTSAGGGQGGMAAAAHGGSTVCAPGPRAAPITSAGSGGTGDVNSGSATRVPACKDQLRLGGVPGTKLGGVAAHGTTGDFNHDGLLDLATADTDASLISILLGHGDGNFTALNQRTAPLPVTLTAADLNADGHLDLVTITGDERAAVTVELGAGDGRFALGGSYNLGAALYGLTIGDFDGDHLLDIAVTASAGALLLHGNGDGSLRPPKSASVVFDNDTPLRVAAADLDDDGRLDLVLGFGSLTSVVLGHGDGTFSDPRDYPAGVDNRFLGVADFNGDGQLDILVQAACGAPSSKVGTWLNAGVGAGSFAPAISVSPDCSYGQTLVTTIDADPRLDLVGNSLLFGQADGTFESVPNDLWSGFSALLAAGDFNGDGVVDLALGTDAVNVHFGNGDGTFGSTRAIHGYIALLEDVNADGKLDVVSADESPGSVNALLGAGDGSFAVPADSYPLCSQCTPSDLLTPDLNGDHLPDLVVVATQVFAALSDGKGGYLPAAPVVNDRPRVAAGDVDGDGIPDLVAADAMAKSLRFLRGKGDGTFAPAADQMLMTRPQTIKLGDLNRDGKLDVALTDDYSVIAMLGDGRGSFAPIHSYETDYYPAIELGDLNGDGTLDLITSSADSVRVQLGIGDGTFGLARDYYVGAQPGAFALGDLNRDGSLDLLVSADRVLALFGSGDGGFACVQDYITEPGTFRISLGDVNRDCRLDALLSGPKARLLLNDSP